MNDLLAARSQMGMSLAFHIIFAVVGIGMPLLMVMAERRWLTTGDSVYLELAKRWAKGTAIMFAVGAVSGTVLSFELGLLWPQFMEFAGPIFGMPFSLEGFAFFVEAIFLGIYLYGWDRLSGRAHLGAGIVVALSGALSGIFVVIANAWMNTPTGFTMLDGKPTGIDPDRRDLQSRGPHADDPHDARRLCGDRIRGGRHSCLPAPAEAGKRLSPPGASHCAARGRTGGPAAAAVRRPERQDGGAAPAGEAGGDGGALPHGVGRAAHHRWHPRRGDRPDPLRDPDPLHAVGARARRSAGGSDRPRSRAARRVAERPPGPPLVPADGRPRHRHDGDHGVGGLARLAPAGAFRTSRLPARSWRSPPRWGSWRSRRDGW